MLKVSVVVPVYNGGEHLDRCAPSLTGQSLGSDAYEVLYVNDGSTDDSAERLRKLAAAHPHVRVHHQENSGWPGKPRNVGVQLARGTFVQFVDQDDELAAESLERLLRLAERNNSDIVLGKVFGNMSGPSSIFKRTIERCTVADAPLMESLTPHKMFRRSFLMAHGITFPEGRVRLEDQLFMARAYVRAGTVSILSDYPTYRWVRHANNSSSGATSAEGYYRYLRHVVEAIKEGTPAGELQDRLLRRSYRVELLRPVTEPRVLQRTGDQLREYFDVVRAMALECYPPGVKEGMPAIAKLRATLLEDGRLNSLVELARRTQQIRPRVESGTPNWQNGKLVVPVTVRHVRGDGEPLSLVERDGRMYVDPILLDGIEGAEDWQVNDPFSYTAGELLVQDGTTGLWWYPDGELASELRSLGGGAHQLVMTGDTDIDLATLAGGGPMSRGEHYVWLNYQLLGIGRRARVASEPRPRLRVGSGAGRIIVPDWAGEHAQLRLTVGEPVRNVWLRRSLASVVTHPVLRRTVRKALRTVPTGLRLSVHSAAVRVSRWSRGIGRS